MNLESLKGLSPAVEVEVLLAALELASVDTHRIRQIFNDTGSDAALRYLADHEHTAAMIKQRILTLFSLK